MPTIEIISLKTTGLEINHHDFDVTIIEENVLKSHRGLFFDFLSKQQGTMMHIGNPNLKNNTESGFWAGDLIDWEFENPALEEKPKRLKAQEESQEFLFQFKTNFKNEIEQLMEVAINKSPIHKIYFLTDSQFGSEKAGFKQSKNLRNFWQEHDQKGLTWNTLYEIVNQ